MSCLIFWAISAPGIVPLYAQTTPNAAESGKVIYQRSCVSCHGADGRGGRMAGMLSVKPKNLADAAYMTTRSDEQLFSIIKEGGPAQGLSKAMPGFANQLSDEQIHQTIAYVRTLSSAQAASPTSTTAPSGGPATTGSTPQPADPATLQIDRLRLSIWPEYDDPRVLILLRGQLTPNSPLPTILQLPIPKGAEIIGAGMVSAQNTLLNHPHQVVPGDDHDILELTLPVARFFVEWYYDPYRTTDRKSEKQFTFTLNMPYTITQLDADILKPYEATDFRTDPETDQQTTDQQGGTFYQFSSRDVKPGPTTSFTITYVKTTDEPSVKKQQANAVPVRPRPDGGKSNIAFAILAGVIALYASGFVLWRNYLHRRPSAPVAVPTTPPTSQAPEHVPPPAPAANFCSNCGRQRQPDDRFCSGCGRAL